MPFYHHAVFFQPVSQWMQNHSNYSLFLQTCWGTLKIVYPLSQLFYDKNEKLVVLLQHDMILLCYFYHQLLESNPAYYTTHHSIIVYSNQQFKLVINQWKVCLDQDSLCELNMKLRKAQIALVSETNVSK